MDTAIIIAPFSNSDIRDWPAQHFIDLIRRLMARFPDRIIRIVGSASQFARAAEIVRSFDSTGVRNDCGRFCWTVLRDQIAGAACVIANNSGIAHLGAFLGAPTLCIFGGAHNRYEWGPRGRHVRMVSLDVPCSPCHRHAARECPFALECLTGIDAEHVAQVAFELMRDTAEREVSDT